MAVEPEVRSALPVDRDECIRLENEARLGLSEQRGGEALLAEHPPLSSLSVWPDTWVGTIDGVIVGFLVGSTRDDAVRGRLFTVDRVYVRAEARELGFGDALVAVAMAAARESGCHYFEATALPGDRETKNLYERAAVTARSIVVSRRLD